MINHRGCHCSIRLGIFLRRYPMARVFIILYMVNTFENAISAYQGTVFSKSWKIYWLAFTGSTTLVGHDCSSDIHTWNAPWSSCWKIEGLNALDGCLFYSLQSRNDISCSLVVFGSWLPSFCTEMLWNKDIICFNLYCFQLNTDSGKIPWGLKWVE